VIEIEALLVRRQENRGKFNATKISMALKLLKRRLLRSIEQSIDVGL